MGLSAVKIAGAQGYKNGGGLVGSLQALAAAGRLFELDVYNSSANTYYIHIHDIVGAPTDMTKVRLVIPLPAGSYATGTWVNGKPFTTACFIGISTTNTTYTASGNSDCTIDADVTQQL